MRIRPQKRERDLEADPANHYARLADDIGHNRRSYRARDDGKPLSGAVLLLQPLSLFLISLLALATLGVVHLWRAGVFDPIFAARGAVVDASSRRWILNNGAARVVDDRSSVPEVQAVKPVEPVDEDEAEE